MMKFLSSGLFLLLLAAASPAEPAGPLTLEALRETYQARVDAAEAEAELALLRLGRQYLDQLSRLFDEAREAADLELATEVRAERQRFEAEGTVSGATAEAAALRHLQSVYQMAAFRIRREEARAVVRTTGQMDTALQQLERQLTSENRIEAAVEIRGVRLGLTQSPEFLRMRALALAEGPFPRAVASDGIWQILAPQEFASRHKTEAEFDETGAVFVSGEFGRDVYVVDYVSTLPRITAVRLEALADPRLPSRGPGRAPNGNFVVHRFQLFVADEDGEFQEAAFAQAVASHSQPNFPVHRAIQLQGGWGIHQGTGRDQQALFVLEEPVRLAPGQRLRVRIAQWFPDQRHSLGKFRISITDHANPLTE